MLRIVDKYQIYSNGIWVGYIDKITHKVYSLVPHRISSNDLEHLVWEHLLRKE